MHLRACSRSTNPAKVAESATALATKVDGHWLFSFAETTSIAPPTLDVY
jgi:hypothetical protein